MLYRQVITPCTDGTWAFALQQLLNSKSPQLVKIKLEKLFNKHLI